MNTDNFIIESCDIELAQNICKMIADTGIRNRAVANAIAGSIASKFFDKDTYDVDSQSGLHNIGLVLEDIDISDIYINRNYIDARVFFSEEEISVPEAHFNNNLLPLAYMFIKINEDLSGASVIGFITPENIQKNNLINGSYYISENDLQSFYDIETLIVNRDEDLDISDSDIYAYIDNRIENKNEFYSTLLQSKEGRIKLAKAIKAKEIFKFISVAKNTVEAEELPEQEEDTLQAFDEELSLEGSAELDLIEEMDIDNSIEEDLLSEENSDELSFEPLDEAEDNDLMMLEEAENNSDDLSLGLEEADEQDEEQEGFDAVEFDNEEITLEAAPEIDNLDLINNEQEEIIEDELILDEPEENEPEPLSFVEDEIIEEEPEAEVEVEIEIPEEVKEDIEETYDFSTKATPSNESDDILEELSNAPEVDLPAEDDETENPAGEEIEALFNTEEASQNESEEIEPEFEEETVQKPKSSLKPVTLIAFLIIAGALGYFGYTKYFAGAINEDVPNNDMPVDSLPAVGEASKTEDAMPIETVESAAPLNNQNEGVSDTIPVIEQNLDASILVSNLKVDWEVPAGYASNSSAKRYLVKLGKIIQLNLKTELLLLNKPPITNKISVEIKYNSSSRKFEAAGIVVSSGEKSVDDLILHTVNRALGMNLSTNTDSFAKLQGNPVLIIRL